MLTASLLALALTTTQVNTDPTVLRIIDEGKNRSQVMRTLRYLTKNIGPRATGSPELERAERWAMSEFKRYGLKNVHLEQWGTVPGWKRGARQVGRMVAPIKADFVFTTNVWTDGTTGLVRGKAVENPKSLEEAQKMAKQLKDAWVIMPDGRTTMRGPIDKDPKELRAFVDSCGIAGRVYASKDEMVHTHGTFKMSPDKDAPMKTASNHPRGVEVQVRKSDMDRIRRWLAMEPVTLEFDIEAYWLDPVSVDNVIADLPGTDESGEMVIICGHLDSWNGPGSEGANDNGTGSSVAIEAARILSAVKAKPKRTIRFILWTGEEQGLLGSFDYVKKHEAEMPKISAVINDDGGTGYHGGYRIIESMKPMLEEALKPLNAAFPDLQAKLEVEKTFPREWGSDHAAFFDYDVPSFDTIEGGDVDYYYIWHTQHDKLEQSIPRYLVQSATEAASTGYYLAQAPTLLPKPPKPEPEKPAK